MESPLTCGLDEAGRGPLAGPVTAGCAVLPAEYPRGILADSKAMTEKQREKAFAWIQERAFWGIGWCSAAEIDEINILQASLLAMQRALEDLQSRFPGTLIAQAIVDGLHCPALTVPCRALVKADALEPCVSAASILAKVARDRFMREAHEQDPRYGFAIHKGYPTLAHRKALVAWGPGPLHRVTFAWKRPVE